MKIVEIRVIVENDFSTDTMYYRLNENEQIYSGANQDTIREALRAYQGLILDGKKVSMKSIDEYGN
jgi:hypothetical protein